MKNTGFEQKLIPVVEGSQEHGIFKFSNIMSMNSIELPQFFPKNLKRKGLRNCFEYRTSANK